MLIFHVIHLSCILTFVWICFELKVNCLEPHPFIPVLATSGLDDDVKIWSPKRFEEPQMWDLKNVIITNILTIYSVYTNYI